MTDTLKTPAPTTGEKVNNGIRPRILFCLDINAIDTTEQVEFVNIQ